MSQHQDPTVKWVDVTPELAEEWLGKNIGNRNKRNARIAAYARDMKHGTWLQAGDPIRFDWNGRLIDAQHRLEAVIVSGVTVRMLVIWGVDPKAQSVIDQNIKRSGADALGFNGVQANRSTITAIARLDLMWKTTKDRRANSARIGGTLLMTNSELLTWVEANQDVHDAAAYATRIYKEIKAPPSTLAYAIMRTFRIDADIALDFWESTAEMRTNGPGDPRHTLLKYLKKDSDTGSRSYQTFPQLSYYFRAWNAFRDGKDVFRFQLESGSGGIYVPDPR